MSLKHQLARTWVYPPIGPALEMVILDDIGVYIVRHQNTFAQYIATCCTMELCLAAEQWPGMQLLQRCWEHPALDILRKILGHSAAEMGEETGMEESEGYSE